MQKELDKNRSKQKCKKGRGRTTPIMAGENRKTYFSQFLYINAESVQK